MNYTKRTFTHACIFVIAVTDDKKRFIDFAAGYPGCMHDARIMRNSTIADVEKPVAYSWEDDVL